MGESGKQVCKWAKRIIDSVFTFGLANAEGLWGEWLEGQLREKLKDEILNRVEREIKRLASDED